MVQRLLGHKTITETLDTYGHLMSEDLDRLGMPSSSLWLSVQRKIAHLVCDRCAMN